jgi:tetratricopeptide (TPR) repeat protein
MEAHRKIALFGAGLLALAGCVKKPVTPAGPKPPPVQAKDKTPSVTPQVSVPTPSASARTAEDDFARGVQLADTNPEEAIEAFRKAIVQNPRLFVAEYNLAVLYEHKGDNGAAEQHYRACLQESSDYAPALGNLINLLVRRGEGRRALEAAQAAVAKNPQRLDLRALKAKALVASGDPRSAISEAKAILREDEKNVGAMMLLANVYFGQGKNELTAHILRQSLKIDPDNPEAHHLLGHALVALDEKAKALQSFQKAIELRRDFPEALNSLAVMLLQTGDVGRALNYLEDAVKIAPTFREAHLNLGNAYRKSGEVAKAKASYERVLELQRGSPDAYYNLALLYLDHEMPDAPDEIRRLEVALEYFKRYRDAKASLASDDPATRYVSDAYRKLAQLRKTQKIKLERDRLKKLKKEMEGQKLQMGGK